jgi:hypothetical protein
MGRHATHNWFAVHAQSPRGSLVVQTHTVARLDLRLGARVSTGTRPPLILPMLGRLPALLLNALPVLVAADSGKIAPTLDASVASSTSPKAPSPSAPLPAPAARRDDEFLRSLGGLEPAVRLERRQRT